MKKKRTKYLSAWAKLRCDVSRDYARMELRPILLEALKKIQSKEFAVGLVLTSKSHVALAEAEQKRIIKKLVKEFL